MLAVGVVAAWRKSCQDVWTGETLKRALSAAGAAVFGHSLVAEKLKIMRKSQRRWRWYAIGDRLKARCRYSLCSGHGLRWWCCSRLDYCPSRSRADGCPDVSIRQPLPAPKKRWSRDDGDADKAGMSTARTSPV